MTRAGILLSLSLLVSLVVVGVSLAGAQPVQPPVNLLPNPSFEQPQANSAELAANWAPYQCGYTRTRERSYAPDISGAWSLRIAGAGQADEKGIGGCNTGLSQGLPAHGAFAATNSIYVAAYTQGAIYGAYVTAGYADGTERIFSFQLSDAQIKANLGHWKTYRLAFTTDPQKKLKTLSYWCLVWARGQQKFIGTVYFDDVELRQVGSGEEGAALLPFALASHTPTPPRVDGVMDDECWRRSPELSPFLLSGGAEAATEQTRARLAYDEGHLYLCLECCESVLDPVLQKRAAFKAEQTAHDSNVFSDDVVELFLQPSPDQPVYYHLAVNSRGAVYDAHCQAEGIFDKAWDSGAQAQARVGDKSWTLEIAIPRDRLGAADFGSAGCWRVNLCREEKPAVENSCWSPTGGPFHTPARFGVLGFGSPSVSAGSVDLGALRKGTSRVQLTVSNATPEAHVVSVAAAVVGTNPVSEIGRAMARVEPGQSATIPVEYTATSGEGALRYEIVQDGRLVLLSPGYPLQSDSPFIACVSVLGKNQCHVATGFSVAEGEPLVLPLVLPASFEEAGFRDAQVTLEVPEFLRLVSPLGVPRRFPAPLRVQEETISREGQPYRRLVLDFGPASVTYAAAREQREYVENPLVFRAEYVGRPDTPPSYVVAYEMRLNGQSKAEGAVPLTLLPPLARKSPRQLVVCNWPCGSTYYNGFFGRLSLAEQEAIFDSWTRTGFNSYSHAGSLAKRYEELGLKTALGLPGTLDGLCASVPEVSAYLRAHPEFQDANGAGKALPGVVSPAYLLTPDCPVRPLIGGFVAKAAGQYPVLSWDYEVPVARPESIGFGPHNLAAFRQFARIADTVALTPEAVLRDYRPQWIDFRCRQNAGVVKLLQDSVKAANPKCEFFVYSGYQGAHTQETYGINWEYVAPYLDQAWCGYGRPVQETQDTLRALQGKPLVGGELAWLGDGHPYDQDGTELNLLRRLTDCAGGVMVYYDWLVDGRFYTGLSRTAAVAADFEPFFRDGRRDDSLATVQAGGEGNVVVYTRGAERLVFLFGAGKGMQDFRVQVKGLPVGAVGLDYWDKQPVAVSPLLTASVPANGVKIIHVRPSAGTAVPAAPRLVSPTQGTVSDRRPLLVWDQDGGADCRYRVEVSESRAFPPASTLCAADLATNTHVLAEPLTEDGTFFWRVRAQDALSGKQSAWSPVGQFTLGILGVAVEPTVFSPNGDGRYDAVTLQAELRQAAPWKVVVADATGKTVKTVTGQGARLTASWDGRDSAGQPAAEGKYELRLTVKGRQIAARTIELNRRFGVPNPDLERWCFWRPQALPGGATEMDYHTPAGKASYSLLLTGADPEARAYWSNYRSGTEIPITAGKTYTFSGLVRTDLPAGAEASIRLHFFTRDDRWAAIPGLTEEWEGVAAPLQGKQDWTRLTVSCQAPANAAKAVLFFSLKGQGRAWMSAAEFGESRK
ncbi:hypothetical protein LLH23_21850 [bacterium]|nr:hypothetical protein [bacterium]